MINVLQLLVHLPLFNIKFPKNAEIFYSFLIEIANINILPDFVFDKIYCFLETRE